MPSQVPLTGRVRLPLRVANRVSVKPQQQLVKALPTIGSLGDQHHSVWQNRECTQIKGLVMQRAQCQAVLLFVGPARLMPLNVCRLQAQNLARRDMDPRRANNLAYSTTFALLFTGVSHRQPSP